MLKWKQRLEIKKQFITDKKRDTNSIWCSPEVMKCGKLKTATKTSETNPCEKAAWKLKKKVFFFFLFNEDQYSGIPLLLDGGEGCDYTHKSFEFVFCSQLKKAPQMWCPGGVLEDRKSVNTASIQKEQTELQW